MGPHSIPPGTRPEPETLPTPSGARQASAFGTRSRLIAALGMAAVVALTTSLGLWQLRRAEEKRGLQAQAERAARQAPLRIGRDALPDPIEGVAVSVTGRFLPEATVFIDNRTHQGVAGFHVLTPVRITGTVEQVMVLRGWVARDPVDRNRLPPVNTPEGEVTVTGTAQRELARALELSTARAPQPGERLWQNFDAAVFTAWSGLSLRPLVVRQAPGGVDDGLVRQWRSAGADVDKHRGYAVQWFAMAAAAGAVALYLFLSLLRHARSAPSEPLA
ncbi:MAG: SURF1 family protein [Betaproteobacteria bacterium]|nr:SURF1 family protein [Betaproteobacteria bacterium]